MSIGINSSTTYQPASTQLDFSALSGKSPQTNTFNDESTAQAVDPSALLFDTASQKDVSFGKPDNTVQSPTDSSAATDPQSNVVKLLSALVTSLLQMLMNLNKKQDTGQDSNEWQDPFQNNGGLGTPSTEGGGGGGGTEAASGGDDGGGGTTAASGGGDGWTCADCDGARVKPGVAQVVCRGGKGQSRIRYKKYEGEIFTDYYFGEANTANKSDNYHSNAINENFNWGRISGLLHFESISFMPSSLSANYGYQN